MGSLTFLNKIQQPLPRFGSGKPTIQTVTASNFNRLVLQSDKPVVIEVVSENCPHDSAVDRLAQAYQNKIRFFQVNADQDPKLASQMDAESWKLVFFDAGQLKSDFAYYGSYKELNDFVESNLS